MKSLTQRIGSDAEKAAIRYLKKQGFRLVCQNYTATRIGEIDLIMVDGSTLVFVEVRLRNNPKYGTGADTVTRAKQNRIIRTAQHYLKSKSANPDWNACRFDVMSIGKSIDWIPGAFTLD